MKSFTQFALNEAYEQVEKLGDKLIQANKVIIGVSFGLLFLTCMIIEANEAVDRIMMK